MKINKLTEANINLNTEATGKFGLRLIAFQIVVASLSYISDSLVTLWTVACQVPLSMEFSREEYWSGLPLISLRESS